MREIKFRGYNRKNKQWLYGFYLQNRGAHFVCPDEFATGKSWDDYEVDPETVGQFADMKDKNGIDIYEGDILELKVMLYGKQVGDARLRKVIWKDTGLYVVNKYGDCVCEAPTTTHELEYTVIGDIYDNPKLLKR